MLSRIDVLTLDLSQAREELAQAKKRIAELELEIQTGEKIICLKTSVPEPSFKKPIDPREVW